MDHDLIVKNCEENTREVDDDQSDDIFCKQRLILCFDQSEVSLGCAEFRVFKKMVCDHARAIGS